MSKSRQVFSMIEISEHTGLAPEIIYSYIEQEWLSPIESQFDEEDLARLRLIIDLQKDLEVNDAAVPVILHLIDQIHYLRNQVLGQNDQN